MQSRGLSLINDIILDEDWVWHSFMLLQNSRVHAVS